jgi:hypothetical protein
VTASEGSGRISLYLKLFYEKQLDAAWRGEAEENFQQKIILVASIKKLKKDKTFTHNFLLCKQYLQ